VQTDSFAAASHNHAGADINSGTISNDRMPSAISVTTLTASGNIESTAGSVKSKGIYYYDGNSGSTANVTISSTVLYFKGGLFTGSAPA
jgi:hypothetical protein